MSEEAASGQVSVMIDKVTGGKETALMSLIEPGLLVDCDPGVDRTCALIDWRFMFRLSGGSVILMFYVLVKRKGSRASLRMATINLYGGTTVALRGSKAAAETSSIRMLVGLGNVDNVMVSLAKQKKDLLILASEGYREFFPMYAMCPRLTERFNI